MDQQSKPLYQVTHTTDSNSYDTTRGAHRTKQVHYVLYDGVRSYLELPLDQYDAQRVQELLEHAAQQHVEVMQLQGPPVQNGQPTAANPWLNTGT